MSGQKLRGLAGQGMNGRRPHVLALAAPPINVTSGSGTVTARTHCIALIYAWGGGGSTPPDPGSNNATPGAGGGAALYKRVTLNPGQTLTYSVGAGGAGSSVDPGNNGGDTMVTLPNGCVLRAGGGKGSTGAVGPGALGGIASGGDVNRSGGAGGDGGGSVNTDGSAGQGPGGGSGGAKAGNCGGGGGAGGLSDLLSDFPGGNGSDVNGAGIPGAAPGGGCGAGGSPSKAGGTGKLVIVFVRTG